MAGRALGLPRAIRRPRRHDLPPPPHRAAPIRGAAGIRPRRRRLPRRRLPCPAARPRGRLLVTNDVAEHALHHRTGRPGSAGHARRRLPRRRPTRPARRSGSGRVPDGVRDRAAGRERPCVCPRGHRVPHGLAHRLPGLTGQAELPLRREPARSPDAARGDRSRRGTGALGLRAARPPPPPARVESWRRRATWSTGGRGLPRGPRE